MAGFIKSQSLTLPEKMDGLDADEQATMGEKLHELAEELQNSIQTSFEGEKRTEDIKPRAGCRKTKKSVRRK
ncbi:RNA polymerase [Salmonella enterica subsp. enterica serovar Typhimurium]|nr:RNA polymerase [Salmonella enterica subsp. enterica serovar Typhimurium]